MFRTAAAIAILLMVIGPTHASAAPRFSLAPREGPPGTAITLTANVPEAQRGSYLKSHTLTLERNANGGLFQLFDDGTVTIDHAGHLTGTFHVPTQGDYDHGQPDALFHPATPGLYQAYFPCHACALGLTFTVTNTAPALPATGARDEALIVLAGVLLLAGFGCLHLGQRRSAPPG